jgi:hypothetical protein
MPDWDELREKERKERFRKKHGLSSEEEVKDREKHGEVRTALHQPHKSHRPLSKNYESIGLAGEQAFAEFMGVDWDRELRPEGSNSINFRFPGGTVNVYCANKPKNLLVEVGKAKADYYVLAMYRDGMNAYLMGWATKSEVLAVSPEDKGGKGVVSHFIPWDRLRPMKQLRDVLQPPTDQPKQESLL